MRVAIMNFGVLVEYLSVLVHKNKQGKNVLR